MLIGGVFIKHPGSGQTVLGIEAIVGIMGDDLIAGGPFLDENIVAEPVIPMEDGHEAHNLRPVGHMVGGIPPAGSVAHAGQSAADQIVDQGDTLGGKPQTDLGEQDVVVDERGAVAHFHEDILGHHAALEILCKGRLLVVMEQIPGQSGALGFPVAPDAHGTVVDMVAPQDHINGCVHFDARDLRTAQLHHIVDMVDMVILNDAEHTAHAADDAALFAVVDVVSADNMAADVLLQPAVVLTPADRIPLHLGGALHMVVGKELLVFRVKILPQGNTGASAVGDITVLDDPALAPVGADHAILESGRRGPGGCGLCNGKAADGNIGNTGFGGEEAFPADVDLHIFLIGIFSLEIGIENGFIPLRVLFGIPFIDGFFRHPAAFVDFALQAVLQGGGFVQCPVI